MKPDNTQLKLMQDHKTPGMSLTAPKDQKLPFNRPPEIVDKQEALDKMWKQLSSPSSLPELIKLLRRDVPVIDIAQVYAKMGFAEGKWSVDMSLQLIEPATFMIMHIARKAGVDYVFSKEIPDLNAYAKGENEEFLKKAMNSNQEEMGEGLLSEDLTESPDIDVPEGDGIMEPEPEEDLTGGLFGG